MWARFGRTGQVSQHPFGPLEPANAADGLEVLDPHEFLAERIPDLFDAIWAVTYEQFALVPQVVGDTGTHKSVRLLFSLAVNDLRDLLSDIGDGQGRSAMGAARSVIEHAINLRTVGESLAQANLYLEHLDQGPALLADLAVGAERLEKRSNRSYLHALKKVGGPARARFEKAVTEHGPHFRRGWTTLTLRDRARRHDLDHLYAFYQLASLVTHGSAGGILGTIHDQADPTRSTGPEGGEDERFTIFRTGPALELAPVALWAGLAGYREVLDALTVVRPDLDVAAYAAGLDALDGLWVDYFTTLRDLDAATWPTERRPNPMAICAFNRLGRRRWYLHLPLAGILLCATPPELPALLEENIRDQVDRAVREDEAMFRNDQRWLTIAVPHVTAAPDKSGRWIPQDALFEKPRQIDGRPTPRRPRLE